MKNKRKIHTKVRKVLHQTEHKVAARATLWSHLGYYVLVSMEAHGNYRYAAGVVAVLVAYEAFIGKGPPE